MARAPTPESFPRRVAALVSAIPAGRVMGYGHVAAALGAPGAARQVGWALAGLPRGTEVPWQRVLRSSGQIACAGDPARPLLQKALLEAEGVEVQARQPNDPEALWVDMRRFGWTPGEVLGEGRGSGASGGGASGGAVPGGGASGGGVPGGGASGGGASGGGASGGGVPGGGASGGAVPARVPAGRRRR